MCRRCVGDDRWMRGDGQQGKGQQQQGIGLRLRSFAGRSLERLTEDSRPDSPAPHSFCPIVSSSRLRSLSSPSASLSAAAIG